MKLKKGTPSLELLILFLALALRVWALDLKPPHFDEGINGWFADSLRQQGFYAYDPTNFHGPLYFYVLFLVQTLFGRSLWVLRMPAVLGSLATVWLALRFNRFLGKQAARWGALTLAVSPAMVFYGRYAIHESWVAASLMVVLLGLFGLSCLGDRRSLFLTMLGMTLLVLLKETAVIHFGSLLVAAAFLLLWHRLFVSHSSSHAMRKKIPFSGLTFVQQSWNYRDLCNGILLSLAAIFFFYSGGLLNIRGFLNLFRTLSAWVHTGIEAGGHVKSAYQWGPLNYYWPLLMARYEAASLVGFFYSLWLLWKGSQLTQAFHKRYCDRWRNVKTATPMEAMSSQPRASFPLLPMEDFDHSLQPIRRRSQRFWLARYLAIYALGALVIYSIIPYKTPWCLISILWPFSLLFGVFLQHLKNKKLAVAIGTLFLSISFILCLRLNFWHYADFSEPYVYVQTSPEINRLTTPLLAMAKKDPRNLHLRGQILLESYYPIPWILGDFTSIGYFSKTVPPKKLDGDFIVVEASRSAAIEKQLHEPYYREEFELRDAMGKCVVYFKKAVFGNFFDQTDSHQQKLLKLI